MLKELKIELCEEELHHLNGMIEEVLCEDALVSVKPVQAYVLYEFYQKTKVKLLTGNVPCKMKFKQHVWIALYEVFGWVINTPEHTLYNFFEQLHRHLHPLIKIEVKKYA